MPDITLQEARELARDSGLSLGKCPVCHQSTLWRTSRQLPVAPRTCGRMTCGRKAKEPWAKAMK